MFPKPRGGSIVVPPSSRSLYTSHWWHSSYTDRYLLKQLLFVGVLATAINWTGMEFFLFRFDDSAAWKQILWFCAMIFIPIGPALHCFLVYSRSKVILHALAIGAGDVSNGTKREFEV